MGQITLTVDNGVAWIQHDYVIDSSQLNSRTGNWFVHQAHNSNGITTLDHPSHLGFKIAFKGSSFAEIADRFFDAFRSDLNTALKFRQITEEDQKLAYELLVDARDQQFMDLPDYPTRSEVARFERHFTDSDDVGRLSMNWEHPSHPEPNIPKTWKDKAFATLKIGFRKAVERSGEIFK